MSFGFAVGDFIQTLELATKVAKAYRNGPQEYSEICAETKALQATLKNLRDGANDGTSLLNSASDSRKQELLYLVAGCRDVLNQANEIAQKHSKLENDPKTSALRRVWHAYRAGRAEINVLTQRMTFHVACIAAFIQSLHGSSFAKAVMQIDQMHTAMKKQGMFGNADDGSVLAWAFLDGHYYRGSDFLL